MAFSREIYTQATNRMQQRRKTAEQEAERRRRVIHQKIPRIAQLEQQIAGTGMRVAKLVVGLSPEKSAEAIEQLKAFNLKTQTEIAELLLNNGFAADSLHPKYQCPVCEDTGYDGPYFCKCYKQLLTQLALEKLNRESAMELCSFDTFSLGYYSTEMLPEGITARDCMTDIYNQCRSYAANFALPTQENPNITPSPSLLFSGSTGLGKTHLSLAIAREVIEKGYGVLYVSSQNLLSAIEKEHFDRDGKRTDTLELASNCDLLILDDLGAEFQTQFTQSTIYNLLNTRMIKRLPFIISTNLTLQNIEKLYTERVVSRLLGSCRVYRFYGKDVRHIQFAQRFREN